MKRKESLDVQRKRRWIRELDGCDLLECELEITFYIPRDDCSMCNLLYEWSICHEKNENKKRIIHDSSVMLFRKIVKKSGKCCCVVTRDNFYSGRTNGFSPIAISTGDCSHAKTSGERGIVLATGHNGEAEAAGFNSIAVSTGYKGTASSESEYGVAVSTGPEGTAFSAYDEVGQTVIAAGHQGKALVAGKDGFAIAAGLGGKAIALGGACVAISTGMHAIAKGVLGAWIVVAGYRSDGSIECIKCAEVDGVSIKAGVYYAVYNGELLEVQDKKFTYFHGYFPVELVSMTCSQKTGPPKKLV